MNREFDIEVDLVGVPIEDQKALIKAAKKAAMDHAKGTPGMILAQVYLSTDKTAIRVTGGYAPPPAAAKIKAELG